MIYREEYKEVECPFCKGYIYKYGIYEGDKPWICVRCNRRFSRSEYEKLWKEEFVKRGGVD